ncbi:MAG: hypothetical protein IJ442_08360 [Bacteroidaceae bacterium]|nr:hypothetical protein [Bacteroidaceae bacterium]
MKKLLGLVLLTFSLIFCSCEKSVEESSYPTLAGKTFVYSNGQTGSMKIEEGYRFDKNGDVYYYSQVGTSSRFDTDGCSLYYNLYGSNLTIYYGVKGWNKNVRHTVFASGTYNGNYITIDGDNFYQK